MKKGKKVYKPLESLLIKPSGPDCNLNCTYCFYREKAALFPATRTHKMSHEVLHALIRQAMEQSGKHISFSWQGGEPTLMGVDFFQAAVKYEVLYGRGKVIGNGLQTNGVLLDEKWADFLRQYNFLVGLSLDGPQHIHDYYRRGSDGGPSWQRVMKSARLLLSKGVPVNAICCVTSHSANHAGLIYAFYKELGLRWMQFIPVVETDAVDHAKAAEYSVSAEQYGLFLMEVFDLWLKDFRNGRPTTSIRLFDSVLNKYAGIGASDCHLCKECGVYLTVEYNGDLYPCDFFVAPEWKIGNLVSDRLIDALNSRKQQKFGRMKTRLPTGCRHCDWYLYCFGGCTKDRIRDPRDKGMPRFCRSMDMLMRHAEPVFSKMVGRQSKL